MGIELRDGENKYRGEKEVEIRSQGMEKTE